MPKRRGSIDSTEQAASSKKVAIGLENNDEGSPVSVKSGIDSDSPAELDDDKVVSNKPVKEDKPKNKEMKKSSNNSNNKTINENKENEHEKENKSERGKKNGPDKSAGQIVETDSLEDEVADVNHSENQHEAEDPQKAHVDSLDNDGVNDSAADSGNASAPDKVDQDGNENEIEDQNQNQNQSHVIKSETLSEDEQGNVARPSQAEPSSAESSSNGASSNGDSAQTVQSLPKKITPRSNNTRNGGPPYSDSAPFAQLRILVDSREASEVIGRQGSVLNSIKTEANVRLKVSTNYAGAQERLVFARGKPEEVAKAAGLITRVFKRENFGQPSTADSEPYTMKLVIPHCMMGCLIGKGGSKFREIEEASNARLKALDKKMPFSGDRLLTVYGVADAIHLALYYIWHTYCKYLDSNMRRDGYDPYNPEYSYQRGVVHAVPPSFQNPHGHSNGGGKNHGSNHGHSHQDYPSDSSNRQSSSSTYQQNPYASNSAPGFQQSQSNYHNSSNRTSSHTPKPQPPMVTGDESLYLAQKAAQSAPPDKQLVSAIQIPEMYVGSVIGKGGSKIKEIRRVSGADVQVGDRNSDSSMRPLTITGLPNNNQLAIYLIHQRIENDKVINNKNAE